MFFKLSSCFRKNLGKSLEIFKNMHWWWGVFGGAPPPEASEVIKIYIIQNFNRNLQVFEIFLKDEGNF